MKQKKKHRPTDETLSWKELLRLYRKIRIPWGMLILVGGFSLLIKQAQLWLVPYTSKIMTGAITEHGFIAGFVGFTLLYTLVEALQGGINELTGQITQRNVRHTVWNRILRLPMSYFGDQDRQGLVSRVTQDTTGTYAAIAAMIQLISVVYGTVTAFQKMYIAYRSLALIMLSGIPITIFSTWLLGKMQYKISYINNTAISKMTNFFAERLPGIMRIKTAGTEDEEYRKGVQANEERYRAELRQERIFIFTGPIGSMAQYFNQIVLLPTYLKSTDKKQSLRYNILAAGSEVIRVKVEIKMTETAKEPYAVIFTNEMTEAVRQAAAILEGAVSNKAITVTDNERIFVLRPEELYMLRVENERAAVYTRTKRFDSGRRLYEFEDMLGVSFMRISKSVLINLQYLECVEPTLGGLMMVTLKNGCKECISRKYLPAFKKYLGL